MVRLTDMFPSRGWLLLITTLQCAFHPGGAQAQTEDIGQAPDAARCEIHVRTLVTLGESEGQGIVAGTGIVAVDSHDRYYIAHGAARGYVVVFDAGGGFLTRIGRPGAGPGEYRVIGAIVIGHADSVLVFDNGNTRLSVLTPYPGLQVARTQRIPIPVRSWEAVIDHQGGYVTAFPFAEAGRIGYPLHEVGPDGRIGRSFGSKEPRYHPAQRLQLRRVVARAGDDVWVGHRSQYLIERWSRDNRKLATIHRQVSWFPPLQEELGPITPDQPPPATMTAIWKGPDRRLWVLITVPSENWAKGLRRVDGPDGRAFYEVVSTSDVFSTVIEVLDPSSGAVIASRRVRDELLAFLPDGRILSYREDHNGVPYLDVLRIDLECHSTRR